MPEVLTRHPDTVIQVLESAGARCGEGAPPKILKSCPAESFCALPGGETCVYDVADVADMTQVSAADLAPYVCAQERGCSAVHQPGDGLLLVGLLAGLALGRWSRRGPASSQAPR
ncbi:hypothetical protein OV090_33940 [Nannocystis sp. RBIL2]|uniref:hypothetical protein n=1 Tax=Nannocystis sp. RBIL2 TaxID=2996788 RepID=UPI00226DDE41|nr:hypothetical protein [Nannocystis sp. RBIL2]MCY1069792.1 hypothetical protein [Nannocystis sp. RBIL2]